MGAAQGRERWLLAGQDLLREGGLPAVKLGALTERLGLTTGSFYHHFDNMGAYLDALARYYGADQVETALAALSDQGPQERLVALGERAQEDMGALARAMRDWAGTNEAAADAVRAADAAVLRFLEQVFIDLGHDTEAARVRAMILLSAGVARVHPPWPVPTTALGQIVALLVPVDD